MQENLNMTNPVEEDNLNIGKLVSAFWGNWKLFFISIVLCLIGAAAYLYFAVPQYRVTAKILLSDSQKGSFSSQTDMLADFGYQMGNSNVENEIEVINSMSVARGAVYSSGVYISYSKLGIKETPIYKKASPINVSVTPDMLSGLVAPIKIFFKLDGDQPVKVRYEYVNEALGYDIETSDVEINGFPYILQTSIGDILVEDMRVPSENRMAAPLAMELMATINPLESTARRYMAHLSAAPVSKTSSVAVLAMNTPVPNAGVDYLNAVIESYNNVTNDDKRLVCDYIKTSINEVAAIVGRYHSHCLVENSINGNNNYYIIKFAAPANFPASCQLQMYEAAIDYIVSNSMQQISMLLKPDEANIHASRTQSHLARLRDILSQRSKPQKQQ